MKTHILKVFKIENQGDRTLLFGPKWNYYVIAPPDIVFTLNQLVTYEPFGINFGLYLKPEDTEAPT